MLLYNTPHQAQQRTGQLLLHVTLTNQLRADLQPMSGAECSACFERGARGQAGRLTPYAYTRHMHGVCAAYARGLCAASVLHVHRIQHRICAAGWPSEHAIQWHRAEHGAARGGGSARARVDLVTSRCEGPRPRHVTLHVHVANKEARPSVSRRSGGLFQRQSTPQAAPSFGHPRPISRSGRLVSTWDFSPFW